MGGLQSLGPDDIIAAFYQKHCNLIGDGITKSVLSFLNSGHMLREVNRTYMSLIPKENFPQSIHDYRPISLCNVAYKLIAKVLANRIGGVVHSIISTFQNDFIPS